MIINQRGQLHTAQLPTFAENFLQKGVLVHLFVAFLM